jgi:hypothetical protein
MGGEGRALYAVGGASHNFAFIYSPFSLPNRDGKGGVDAVHSTGGGVQPTPLKLRKALCRVNTREAREGWPLLTVETEVDSGTKSTDERGYSLGLSCRYKRFLIYPACSRRPSTKYFFLTIHYFNSFVPLCWAVSRAGSPVS